MSTAATSYGFIQIASFIPHAKSIIILYREQALTLIDLINIICYTN